MNLSFKSWLETTTSGGVSGATTTASIAGYSRPLFSNFIRKDLLNATVPRKRRRRTARRRYIE